MTERKNILITGASSGLGAEMARQFAAKGRNLALCARRLDRIDELAETLRGEHPGIQVVTRKLDVTDSEAVFTVFREFRDELGRIDRVIANAGLGKGQPLGTGYFERANKQTVQTNVVGLLAQCEAAMEIFLEQQAGHLVVIASVLAQRGAPRTLTAYAASKAFAASLGEGIRLHQGSGPVKVTTLKPGYIESEMTARAPKNPLIVSTEKGVRDMIATIEREPKSAFVPRWPWSVVAPMLRIAPDWLLRKVM
ncbi:SDR family oxidoreductase [Thermocrispum municipale]|uniref:SDR family oxidoreductase n=1 Tax=Thermocrispum municipale TaxID=37926 RepID=UPI0003FC62E0|nr:SDR family oxidoreductase [Thermocrispum municipale]